MFNVNNEMKMKFLNPTKKWIEQLKKRNGP